MIKQVWECKGAHKYRYESPVQLKTLICPKGHESVLIEGELPEYKPVRKRRSKTEKPVEEKSYTETLFSDAEVGKVVAKKFSLRKGKK